MTCPKDSSEGHPLFMCMCVDVCGHYDCVYVYVLVCMCVDVCVHNYAIVRKTILSFCVRSSVYVLAQLHWCSSRLLVCSHQILLMLLSINIGIILVLDRYWVLRNCLQVSPRI